MLTKFNQSGCTLAWFGAPWVEVLALEFWVETVGGGVMVVVVVETVIEMQEKKLEDLAVQLIDLIKMEALMMIWL